MLDDHGCSSQLHHTVPLCLRMFVMLRREQRRDQQRNGAAWGKHWTCWRSNIYWRSACTKLDTRWMLQSVRSRLPALLVYVADTATLKIVARVSREGAHPLGHVKWLNTT